MMKKTCILIIFVCLFLGACTNTAPITSPVPTGVPVATPQLPTVTPQPTPEPTPEPTPTPKPPDAVALQMYKDYADVAAKYEDCIGWIKLEGTNIDYPIFASTTPNYYLSHNRDNSRQNPRSEIYVDHRIYEFSGFTTFPHWILYGHNFQKSEDHFNHLHKYENETFFRQSPPLRLITPLGYSEWQVAAAYQIGEAYDYREVYFSYEDSLAEYFSRCFANSPFQTDVVPSDTDKYLTLSTCDANTSNDDFRFPVQYVLIPNSVNTMDVLALLAK